MIIIKKNHALSHESHEYVCHVASVLSAVGGCHVEDSWQ